MKTSLDTKLHESCRPKFTAKTEFIGVNKKTQNLILTGIDNLNDDYFARIKQDGSIFKGKLYYKDGFVGDGEIRGSSIGGFINAIAKKISDHPNI